MTWAPHMSGGQFQSMQTLDQRGLPTMPYYPVCSASRTDSKLNAFTFCLEIFEMKFF